MSRTSHFRREIIIPATPEQLWDFHADVRNMPKILPPGQHLREVEGDPAAEKGNTFRLHLKLYGLKIRWEIRWKEARRPELLWDEMLRGPFEVFSHQHRFEPVTETTTRLIDDVTYALPRSKYTWPLAETGLRLQLMAMFGIRHRRTLEYFTKATQPGQAHP
jgi:hypothetical protein